MDPVQNQQLADDDAARRFAQALMARFKLRNRNLAITLPQGLWVHHRLRAVEVTITPQAVAIMPQLAELEGQTLTIDVMNLIISGDIECAFAVLLLMPPDDGSEPYHWMTADAIAQMRAELAQYIGL